MSKNSLETATRKTFLSLFANRFIAGETLQNAVRVVQRLNREGKQATINYLGEHYKTEKEVFDALRENIAILRAINQERLHADIAIKLTQFGLCVSPKLTRTVLSSFLDEAGRLGIRVEFDMEDLKYNPEIIKIFYEAYARYPNLVLALQARLKKTEKDIEECIVKGITVRLCKGAYREAPAASHENEFWTKVSFLVLASRLASSRTPRAIATHDRDLIEACRKNFGSGDEFQMLLGIETKLQNKLVSKKYPVRVYVAYGPNWIPFVMRRWRFVATHLKSIL